MRLVGCAIAIMMTLSLAGCDKLKELQQTAENAVQQVARQVESEVDPTEQMMSAYAKGYNEVLNSFQDIVDNYARAIPLDVEPSAELGRVTFFGSSNFEMALKTIKDAFESAASKAPDKYRHLQPLAGELTASCQELATLYGDARGYYQAEDFKDDDYARGKELHGKMRLAAERFDKALRQMEAALSVEEDKLMQEELAEYTDQGTYAYQYRYAHFKAKQVLRVIDSPTSDVAAIDLAVDEFLGVFEQLRTFCGSKADLQATFKAYVDQVENFVGALKRFRREVQADAPNPDKLRQEHDAIVSAYNAIISLRNALSQLEAHGQL
jgi:metal-sulfur cluster biosynthetic enzyme